MTSYLWSKGATDPVRNLRRWRLAVGDAVALAVIPFAAICLRLEHLPSSGLCLRGLIIYTIAALLIRLPCFHMFQLYVRLWEYAGADDLLQIVRANAIAMLLTTAFFVAGAFAGLLAPCVPRSLPLLDGLLTLLWVGWGRFRIRLQRIVSERGHGPDAKPVLVVGAGTAAQTIVRELQSKLRFEVQPIGFIADGIAPGTRLLGLLVFGGHDVLLETIVNQNVGKVIIAIPEASGKTIRELVAVCEKASIPVKIVPGMAEILDERVSVSQLRDIDIEDLLRREAVQADLVAVRALVQQRRVLVTGGGGSIGSELCRQVLHCQPSALALLGHGENSIFDIANELSGVLRAVSDQRGGAEATRLHSYIGDIRSRERVEDIIQEFRPEIIFHAAAHKHVPLMEQNPTEAISNNVLGTRNLLQAAVAADVENLILISTDKVVNPTSIMGASKRVAEMLVLDAARKSGRNYVAVRFGNVLGSRGSVVPTFKKQIAAGGPVCVSHPEMKRYFMTIPEAVQLVLQAVVLGKGGEIFMLDMGAPVRIVDLARDMIELSGLQVGRDIDIVFTGVRPGEKLYEELLVSGENYGPTNHPKVRTVLNASSLVSDDLDAVVRDLQCAVEEGAAAAIVRLLRRLVTEFSPDERFWGDVTLAERVCPSVPDVRSADWPLKVGQASRVVR